MRKPDSNIKFTSFLSASRTIPCLNHDFVEWHNGISHYGFWAVVINDHNWIALWEAAREHVKRFIHPGYERAPHVTIIACGLIDQNRFSAEQLDRQWRTLSEMKISPFYLKVISLNSFTTAPCLMIEDSEGALKRIRGRLNMIFKEDTPVQYQPHLTLGFYRDEFDTLDVVECLKEFRHEPVRPVLTTELFFCTYETRNIQGQFRTSDRIELRAHERCVERRP